MFRDHASGLEFIRSCQEIAYNGLQVAIDGYKYNVFLDFREVHPSKLRPYYRLAAELNGRGVPSIELAALTMSLSPLHHIITTALAPTKPVLVEETFETTLATLLREVALQFSELMEKPLDVPENLAAEATELYNQALLLPELLQNNKESRKLQTALGLSSKEGTEYETLARHWVILDALQQMLTATDSLHQNVIDDWLMSDALRTIYPEAGMIGIPGENLPDLLVCLLTPKPEAEADETPEGHLLAFIKRLNSVNRHHLGRLLQFDERHYKTWFREQRFSVLVAWFIMQELLRDQATTLDEWLEASEQLDMHTFLAGYEMVELLREKA